MNCFWLFVFCLSKKWQFVFSPDFEVDWFSYNHSYADDTLFFSFPPSTNTCVTMRTWNEQNTRITRHLPQKTHLFRLHLDSNNSMHVTVVYLYLRCLVFFLKFFFHLFQWSQGMFQASGKMRWMLTRDSSHLSLWALWDQPNFESVSRMCGWLFFASVLPCPILCAPPMNLRHCKSSLSVLWCYGGPKAHFDVFPLTVCLRCNMRESRHH